MNFIPNNKLKKSDFLPYIFLCIIPVLIVWVLFPKLADSSWFHYLLYLLTFPVTAVIAYFSLTEFVYSKYICFLFSLTYSFMSWHFFYYNQLVLCFYGLLPYAVKCIIKFTLDLDVPDFKTIQGLLIVEIFLIVFQPMWGIVIFTVFFVFTLYRIINRKKINKWHILITFLPALSAVTSGFKAMTYTGIKLAELFIPLENGYVGLLSKIYSFFDANLVQYKVFHIKLSNYSHLGIVLALSLIYSGSV